MTEAYDFNKLPPYIRRHLSTRYRVAVQDESWYGPGEQAEYVRLSLEDRQQNGLKYLALTMRDVRFATYRASDLICMLAGLPTDGTGPMVVSELMRRLSDLDEGSKAQLAETLRQLATDLQQQASERIVADRAIMRLLYRLDFQQAFSAAAACAASPRTTRREAAYRFYLVHGIDEAGRKVLSDKIWDTSTRYRQVITTDRSLVLELGLARVLELAPSTYWRMIAIAKALEGSNYSSVLSITADYPLELIWAINENCITDLVLNVMELLEQYKDDAYLLNRILQCLVRLGDVNSISSAMEYAANLLSGEETDQPPFHEDQDS